MKSMIRTLMVTALIVALAVPALAGPPVPGNYKSENGDFIDGRYTEALIGGDFHEIGNVITTESYNGVLGTQYSFSCPEQTVMATLIFETPTLPILGSGQQIWKKDYSGGTFFLNGTGEAWDGGDASYTGTIDTYSETITIIFLNFQRVSATSDIAGSGTFDNYANSCVTWIANGADVMSGTGYPATVDNGCNPIAATARIGNRTDYTLDITSCVVPTEDSTWGGIKALYDE